MRDFTEQEKQQIFADYNDKTNKAVDVRKKWGISSGDFTVLIKGMGGQMRKPNACKPRIKNGVKVCSNCHKKIEIKGARFCPFCAADIRNEKDILLEKAQQLFSALQYAPNNESEIARQIVIDIVNYLKKGE